MTERVSTTEREIRKARQTPSSAFLSATWWLAARQQLWSAAQQATPVEGLALFRMLYGGLMAIGLSRFLWQGWVEPLFVEPRFFFKFWGLSFIPVWPAWGMYLHYGVLIGLSLCIAVGWYFRVSAFLFVIGFACLQAMDVTNYLNHYVLVVLLGLWLACSPAHLIWSVDHRRRAHTETPSVPAIWYWILRFQVGVVYVFAAVAKLGSDWLLYGQPMGIWMAARTETPFLGPLIALPSAPLVMSWAGFLYDATIVIWLSCRKTRPFAYLTVLLFHGMTSALFDIGMFPGIMIVSTTIFFSPDWPMRLFRRQRRHIASDSPVAAFPTWAWPGVWVVVLCEILIPLRCFVYDQGVLWGEQGMRFSWRVMVREKNASVTYHVQDPSSGRRWEVSPHDYLTWRQANEMSAQPDLILQLAHHIAADFRARGFMDVSVRAEVWASLNGRKPALLLDPDVDLTRVEDGVRQADWILPPPPEPPLSSS